jgi:hypothetical protein
MKVEMLKTCGEHKLGTVCEVPDAEARKMIDVYGVARPYVEVAKPTRAAPVRKKRATKRG